MGLGDRIQERTLMNYRIWAGGVAVVASLSQASLLVAGSDPANLDARIAALEAQIAQLKSESSSWLGAEQTRAIVREAMADSETRASLLREGGTAGFREGKGFFISNEDGTFDVNLSGYSMFRGIYNDKDGPDKSTGGFENSVTKLVLRGHAGSQDLTYKLQMAFDPNGGTLVLDDMFVTYALGSGWGWSWGQVKAPFIREQVMGDEQQLAVERSYVNALTSLGRVQGTWLSYENETIRGWLVFSDGNRIPSLAAPHTQSKNTPFNTDGTEWAVTARIEAILAGSDWKQFNDYESWSTDEFGALFGAAIHWQDGEYGTAAEETQVFTWTVDGMLEFGQANLSAWVVGVHTNPNATSAMAYDQFGFVVQGGVHLVPDKFELFGRYEWFDFDNFGSLDNLSIVTAGFNYYFRRNSWKWTTDIVYALDQIPTSVGATGLLADGAGEDGQLALRTQMQVVIP